MMFDIVLFLMLVLVIVRNVRKDTSEGRDYLGGPGGGRAGDPPTHQK